MGSVWAASVARSLEEALDLLAAVVRDCPDDLWQTPMWRVRASDLVGELPDTLAQRWSTPWSVAWHALEVLDYDLAGERPGWAPPPPFAGHPHWQTFSSLPVPWSPAQIGGYVDHCRQRVRDVLAATTEDDAAAALPPAHRYAGQPYAQLVTGLIGHTTAHAMQIRQFVDAG